jgi:regulatory protein
MTGQGSPGDQTPTDERAAEAYQDALGLLARKPLTEFEVRERLAAHGYSETSVNGALDRLRDAGYVDDQRLAAHFIATRASRLGHGPGRLIEQLRRRGIDPQDTERAWQVAQEAGEIDPGEMLRAEIRRRLAGRPGIVDRRQYGRVYNALLRAGYGSDQIERELGEIPGLDRQHREDDDEFA